MHSLEWLRESFGPYVSKSWGREGGFRWLAKMLPRDKLLALPSQTDDVALLE